MATSSSHSPSVGFVDAAEAGEGGEELVVAADAGGGDEAAHGEGVDEGVVELLVLEGDAAETSPSPQTGCGGRLRVVPMFLVKLRVAVLTQRWSAAALAMKVSA